MVTYLSTVMWNWDGRDWPWESKSGSRIAISGLLHEIFAKYTLPYKVIYFPTVTRKLELLENGIWLYVKSPCLYNNINKSQQDDVIISHQYYVSQNMCVYMQYVHNHDGITIRLDYHICMFFPTIAWHTEKIENDCGTMNLKVQLPYLV
jgi:hypothetical protein